MMTSSPSITTPDLTIVRQLEALGFRAWPASQVQYSGSWAIRLTPDHQSKRLNSVNPLDPGDFHNLDERVTAIKTMFEQAGKRPVFRLSPLAAPQLIQYLDDLGWVEKGRTITMVRSIEPDFASKPTDIMLSDDIEAYAKASLAAHGKSLAEQNALSPALTAILSQIRPAKTMMIAKESDQTVAAGLCVKDYAWAGLFDLATAPSHQRQGLAAALIATSLQWAQQRGAKRAWLQIEEGNLAGLALYRKLGFSESYRYCYREMPQG
ncbi:GNAT family N-acetyltransferase [Paenochrobactrum sp. BZR 588]|uniref:GNAT family N-acetyltransferase n=2 Tax=unclassified Paenochrobactrum TaxID=2639760 RepID=UPI003853D13E